MIFMIKNVTNIYITTKVNIKHPGIACPACSTFEN